MILALDSQREKVMTHSVIALPVSVEPRSKEAVIEILLEAA